MKWIMPILALLVVAAAPAPASVEDFAWMAGSWASEKGERWTEESWSAPRGGVMLGTSRSGRGDTLREFEFLRLQRLEDGAIAYLAQPKGMPPVAFRLIESGPNLAVFANPAHDYPQRIRYTRSGQALTATISALDGTKPIVWTLARR